MSLQVPSNLDIGGECDILGFKYNSRNFPAVWYHRALDIGVESDISGLKYNPRSVPALWYSVH